MALDFPPVRVIFSSSSIPPFSAVRRVALFGGTVILVTNEVGLGIIPGDPLSREYRDLAGIMNQRVAAVADEVVLVVCGLPLVLKQGGA